MVRMRKHILSTYKIQGILLAWQGLNKKAFPPLTNSIKPLSSIKFLSFKVALKLPFTISPVPKSICSCDIVFWHTFLRIWIWCPFFFKFFSFPSTYIWLDAYRVATPLLGLECLASKDIIHFCKPHLFPLCSCTSTIKPSQGPDKSLTFQVLIL